MRAIPFAEKPGERVRDIPPSLQERVEEISTFFAFTGERIEKGKRGDRKGWVSSKHQQQRLIGYCGYL